MSAKLMFPRDILGGMPPLSAQIKETLDSIQEELELTWWFLADTFDDEVLARKHLLDEMTSSRDRAVCEILLKRPASGRQKSLRTRRADQDILRQYASHKEKMTDRQFAAWYYKHGGLDHRLEGGRILYGTGKKAEEKDIRRVIQQLRDARRRNGVAEE